MCCFKKSQEKLIWIEILSNKSSQDSEVCFHSFQVCIIFWKVRLLDHFGWIGFG